MSRRSKIVIITVIVLAGILLAWIFYEKITVPPSQLTTSGGVNTNQPSGQNQQTGNTGAKLPPGPIVNLSPAEQSLYNVARNFAERYGTYSTDSNFENLEEVKLFASAKMAKQIDELIKNSQETAEFYGITSKVLNVDIKDEVDDSDSGQAVVSMQRQETKGSKPAFVFYQKLQLSMIKSGNNWLVDEAKWLNQ